MKIAKNLILIFITGLALISRSQNNNTIELGIEGGPGWAFLRSDETQYNNDRGTAIGFLGGIAVQFNLTKNLAIKSGLAFENKGHAQKVLLTDHLGNQLGNVKWRHSLSYITVPLLFRASFGKNVPFFINAGPFAGFLIHQTGGYYLFSRADAGLSAGLGITIPLNTKTDLTFELRNNLGLMNIGPSEIPSAPVKTNNLLFLTGFSWKLG